MKNEKREEWETQQKYEKEQVKIICKRVYKKNKRNKTAVSLPVTSERRSSEVFYDELVQIWGGSPAIEVLRCGTRSESVNSPQTESDRSDDDDDDGEEESSWNRNNDLGRSTSTQSATESKKISRKRNFSEEGLFPKLISKKRRHLKRQLSAAERDALLIQKTKEDANFRKD